MLDDLNESGYFTFKTNYWEGTYIEFRVLSVVLTVSYALS
jgi:hypothetical protein